MKIMQINNVYDFGSTGKITHDIHHALLSYGYDSVVYYGRRYKTKDENVYRFSNDLYGKFNNGISRITGIKYGGCFISTQKLFRAIKREKPDLIHLQCLNGHFVNIYQLLKYIRKHKIPTILTLHAEFMYTGGCAHSFDCYRWKQPNGCVSGECPQYTDRKQSWFGDKSGVMWYYMHNALSGMDRQVTVVSVSPWLMERAKRSELLRGFNHVSILNGVDTDIFKYYGDNNRIELHEKLEIPDNHRVILHVTPMFSIDKTSLKGGYYVKQLAEMLVEEKVCIVVAGPYDKNIELPNNMIMLGNITDKTLLGRLYSMADCTLLTSKRETFSMVCAESLCCGTPVIGFRAGAPETISIEGSSWFCEYGNVEEINNLINLLPIIDKESLSQEAQMKYCKEKMCNTYIDLYKSVLSKCHGIC